MNREIEVLTGHSYKSHKLWEWLVSDITNFNLGKEPGSPQESEYYRNETRKDLKQVYLKAIGYKPSDKPINDFNDLVDEIPNLTDEERYKLKLQNIRAIQDMLCKDNNFSTAVNLMSQKAMNKLINYTVDLMYDNQIPFRKEIVNLFKEQDMKNYIYICLKHKRCCACGSYEAEIHHVDHVTKIGGYKYDDGTKLRIMPLCRKCHSTAHTTGEKKFYIENEIDGALFSEDEIREIAPHYTNHFKALRGRL